LQVYLQPQEELRFKQIAFGIPFAKSAEPPGAGEQESGSESTSCMSALTLSLLLPMAQTRAMRLSGRQ